MQDATISSSVYINLENLEIRGFANKKICGL
jgi:hypothetical protein